MPGKTFKREKAKFVCLTGQIKDKVQSRRCNYYLGSPYLKRNIPEVPLKPEHDQERCHSLKSVQFQ